MHVQVVIFFAPLLFDLLTTFQFFVHITENFFVIYKAAV